MKSRSHSSNVDLSLIVDGQRIALSHVGSASVIVQGTSQGHPSGDAQIVVTVDGVVREGKVFLPNGVPSGESPKVNYF